MSNQVEARAHIEHQEISIRPMAYADLAVVVELDALVFGATRAAYFERRLALLDAAEASVRPVFLVAESDEAVIGFVMGSLAYGEFGLTQVTAILDSIAVHPGYQRQGVGRQLIEAFIRQSTLQGGSAVYTLVNWDNWLLLKVFQKLGFSLASTVPLERRLD